MIADKEDKGVKSALITYNADKVRISDETGNYNVSTTFDALEDDYSILYVRCYESTMEELYEETLERYRNMDVSLTEIEDIEINGMTFQRYDVLRDGEFHDAYFMLELDNGYILHNGSGHGYDGNIPLEEMLAMSFVNVESGDGTLIRAKRAFKTEAEDGVLTITFDSGEVYTLDYAEDLIEVSTSGSVINVSVLDEEIYDMQFSLYVSEKFDSIEQYLAFSEQDNFMDTEGIGSSFQTNIGGIEFTGIREEALGSNSVDGIFLAKLADGYFLRGEYTQYALDEQEWDDENTFYPMEDVLAVMFGGEGAVLADNTAGEEEKETQQVPMVYHDGASKIEISYHPETIHIDDYFKAEPQSELEVIYDDGNGSYRYLFYIDTENYTSVDNFYDKNVTDCKKMFADAQASELEEIPCGN